MAIDYRGDPPSLIPANYFKYYLPYFTPQEVERLSEKQRGKLSVTQEEKARQQACGFIETVGSDIGFPRKTIATAQNLYHRFHLFFPRKDFAYHDVCLAALFVSCKIHDTLKKTRDVLVASYGARFPERAAKAKAMGGEIDIDPNVMEQDRQRLLAIERLVVETICFNFNARLPFPYVIKISRAFGATRKLAKLAYRLATDSFRTLVNLQYPPHVVALGCLYLAALLSSFERGTSPERPGHNTAHQIAATLSASGEWGRQFQAHIEDIEEIAHALIDLLIAAAQTPTANTSPRTPSSPSPHLSHSAGQQALPRPPPVPYKADQLIRLKIVMRETEHTPRNRESATRGEEDIMNFNKSDSTLLGRNDKTVRFMFGPPTMVDDA
ncbi:cyclin-like protein [Dichomitus squalens]|uniref:Cyclin-like protein n=2 Tax=Dichomitus squalens TaxID=114155 RepID=A0A4Q9NGG5_9APHY|nr:cyclin-like protein [Dichomitus squalens LYAD-421 SS1]EJF61099.1 cyclin-like protein [Dichomitus squalens LYAD-421 SS1]TBU39467.1 cyclin-like protein [Dichomitus squalens]TBU54659.1 cyclin-like protein [Dichomitus squalens]